jgi:pyruvate formate lyase activating enzyme
MLDKPVTSQAQLQQAVDSGRRAGLHYIYTKDLSQGLMLHTTCPVCQNVVIERQGYHLVNNNLQNGRCQTCGEPIAGIGLAERGIAAPVLANSEVV